MKKKLTEETVIFASVIKWVFLATVVGIITGLVSSLFVKTLDFSLSFQQNIPYYFMLLPVILPLVAFSAVKLFPDSADYTTDRVIQAIHKGRNVSLISAGKAFILSIITIAAGGSAGKEAPCADLGAGLGSLFSGFFRFNKTDRKKLMICGVSAGFAGVFGVPVSGAVFGVEVLFVGSILYDVFLPSLVAGVTSYQVSSALGAKYFIGPVTFIPEFSEWFFIKIITAGIFFGIFSFLFIETFRFIRDFACSYFRNMFLRAAAGGLILCIIGILYSPDSLSLGMSHIDHSLKGAGMSFHVPVMKTLASAVTMAFGGIGGVITPVIFAGSSLGAAAAPLFGINAQTFAAIGLVSVLAGVANAPIAASIMAIELFGPDIAPYACVSCVVSFLMTGHRSIYPSQILSVKKSESIQVETGKTFNAIHPEYKTRTKKIVRIIKFVSGKIKNMYR